MKNYYLPLTDAGKVTWLGNFSNKLAKYAAKYNITTAEVTDMIKSYLFIVWTMEIKSLAAEFSARATAFKNEMFDGILKGTVPSIIPDDLVLPPPPEAVAPDIFGRAKSLVNRIKDHIDYTEADGKDLGIEGTEASVAAHILKPVITIVIEGGIVKIFWIKNGMTSLEVWVNRGDGVFVLLTIGTTSPIEDTYVPPADVKSVVCSYKVIYRHKDQRIGNWSDVSEIALKR